MKREAEEVLTHQDLPEEESLNEKKEVFSGPALLHSDLPCDPALNTDSPCYQTVPT